jgi:fatty acid desaturase
MIRSARRPVVINRAVVGTTTVTSVLIVYDGWASRKLLDVVAIIVGPVLAMFIAHVFAGELAAYAARGRRFSKGELRNTVRAELGWLWLAVPPTALLLILSAIGVGWATRSASSSG